LWNRNIDNSPIRTLPDGAKLLNAFFKLSKGLKELVPEIVYVIVSVRIRCRSFHGCLSHSSRRHHLLVAAP